jgi:hypothetical protein
MTDRKELLNFMLTLALVFVSINLYSQDTFTKYQNTYDSLKNYLTTPEIGTFKKAVFITENVFTSKENSETDFNNQILLLTTIAKGWLNANPLKDYRQSDSINLKTNFAIYKLLKDTIKIQFSNNKMVGTKPYLYDFNDFFGHENWSNMFVIKLLATHKGNCHSLPYLYKILADELGATCWLSLAPNHMYIKNRCKKIGWYNTELTSGEFPIDAWITTSGYIPIKAIQTGIYMDTLSNQQAIALCVLDLAKGYEFQTKNYYDGFIIKCCDLVLQYHPVNVEAMLLKAETLKRVYEKQHASKDTAAKDTYNEMEQLYTIIFDLGYREMPEKMYMQWLRSVTEQKNKYGNKQLKETLNGGKTK